MRHCSNFVPTHTHTKKLLNLKLFCLLLAFFLVAAMFNENKIQKVTRNVWSKCINKPLNLPLFIAKYTVVPFECLSMRVCDCICTVVRKIKSTQPTFLCHIKKLNLKTLKYLSHAHTLHVQICLWQFLSCHNDIYSLVFPISIM